MPNLRFAILVSVSAALALGIGVFGVAACGQASDSGAGFPNGDGSAPDGASPRDGGFGDAGAIPGAVIEANAIVLVHAASFPAFRICFKGALGDLPMPTVDLLPDSNVVGVDVGTAVRLPPRNELLGEAFVFPESVLRPLYPAFGGPGPTCNQLLEASATKSYSVAVGEVKDDVSRGVHALVLGGCRKATDDPSASVDRCGADWTAATGNLKLTTLPLVAYARTGETRLSVQLVQLSPSLDRRAAGRALGVAFGDLDGGGPAPMPFLEGAVPFGEAVPNPPAVLDYAATDIGSYATSGVYVTLGAALDDAGSPVEAGTDAGPREVLVMQSLADIQKRSSPRSLPADWFSFASSYVVLSVGDPDPRLGDGGRDDDPRRALHLLAVPLAPPDAGAPAPPAQDAGN